MSEFQDNGDEKLFALDRHGSARVRWACVLSLIANIVLWRMVSAIAGSPPPPLQDIEVTRIIVTPKGVRTVRTVTPKQIAHRVARIHKEIHRREALRPRLQHAPRLAQIPRHSTQPQPHAPQPHAQPAHPNAQPHPSTPAHSNLPHPPGNKTPSGH